MESLIIQNQEFRYSIEKGGALFYVVEKENGDNDLKQIFGMRLGGTGSAVIVNESNAERVCQTIMENSTMDEELLNDDFSANDIYPSE